MLILGIDPGFSGGLAWYSVKDKRLIGVMPMPIRPEGSSALFAANKSSATPQRNVIDAQTLHKAIRASLKETAMVVIERVTASPQMGVTSAFRFGEGYGAITGALAAYDLPVRHVMPSVWKPALSLSPIKKDSLKLACELFPEWSDTFYNDKKSADLAEAALLAHYGIVFLKSKMATEVSK